MGTSPPFGFSDSVRLRDISTTQVNSWGLTAATLPLQLLLLTVSGWVHRNQQEVIAYLVEENRVFKEQLGGRKLQLADDQRRRLAAKAKRLGRRALDAVATLVTPDTLMRWHRRLIALKWTYVAKRVGRPGLRQAIATLIVRMACENDRWGYCRIQGELRKLGHQVATSTIGKVLRDHGIRPAPDRPTSLRAHWGEVAGMDFFTTEVWTPRGLVTYYVLFLLDLRTRRAHIAGLTTRPDGAFIAQVARNLTDPDDGFAHRFVICDRDTKFTTEFRHILQVVGVKVLLTPRRAPNCNAHAERFVLWIKSEGIVKLRAKTSNCSDEQQRAELLPISLPRRHHRPRRLALPPVQSQLPRCRRAARPTWDHRHL